MYSKDQTRDKGDLHPTGDRFEHSHSDDRTEDMRKANENIGLWALGFRLWA